MASAKECKAALHTLAESLAAVPAEVRDSHVPDRTVSLVVTDLDDVAFTGTLDGGGLTDIRQVSAEDARAAQLRLTADSDTVVLISNDPKQFVRLYLSRRVKVAASLTDLLELRKVLL